MSKAVRFFCYVTIASTIVLGLTLTIAIADWHDCTPTEAAVWSKKPLQRIHVKCSEPPLGTNYYYFAYPGAKKYSPDSDRFLNLINFAIQNGKTLAIDYDPADLSGAKIGCLNNDCRLIQSLIVQ